MHTDDESFGGCRGPAAWSSRWATTPERRRRIAVAVGYGCIIAGVAMAAHALLARVPSGRVSFESTWFGSQWLPTTLTLGGLAIGAVALGVSWLVAIVHTADGRYQVVRPWVALVMTVGVMLWVLCADRMDAIGELTGGPGSHHVVAVARVSWMLLAIGGLVIGLALLSGADDEIESAPPSLVLMTVGAVIATLVPLALIVDGGPASLAPSVPTPPVPDAFGEHTAYEVPVKSANEIVPAGAGFVAVVDDGDGDKSLAAYHGESGTQRWRIPLDDLHDLGDCGYPSLSSTGVGADSLVAVSCGNGDEARGLIGIDAMTGLIRWTNTQDWHVSPVEPELSGIQLPLTVKRGNDIAVLDARTGRPMWIRPGRPRNACGPGDDVGATRQSIVYVTHCDNALQLVVLQSDSGAERRIGLPVPDWSSGREFPSLEATGRRHVAVEIQEVLGNYSRSDTVVVDTVSGAYRTVLRGAEADEWHDGKWNQYRIRDYSRDLIVESPHYWGDEVRFIHLDDGWSRTIRLPARIFVDTTVGWDAIGTTVATRAGYSYAGYRTSYLLRVDESGRVEVRPSDCSASASMMVVPGAVLTICHTGNSTWVRGMR